MASIEAFFLAESFLYVPLFYLESLGESNCLFEPSLFKITEDGEGFALD